MSSETKVKKSIDLESLHHMFLLCMLIVSAVASAGCIFLPENDLIWINFFCVIVYSLAAFHVYKKKFIFLCEQILIVSAFCILLFVFFRGGIENGGMLWIFLFPTIIFLVEGIAIGATWFLGVFTVLLVVFFLDLLKILPVPYSTPLYIQFLIIFFLVGILSFLFKIVTYFGERIIENRNGEIAKKAESLKEEIDHRIILEKNMEKVLSAIALEKAKDDVLLSSIGDGIIAIDKDYQIVLFNKSAELMTGWKTEEVLNKGFREVFIVKDEKENIIDNEAVPQIFAIRNNKNLSGNYFLLQKDRKFLSVHFVVSPIVTDLGITGSLTIFRDVTKERYIDKAKTEFVSLASHQLKTPLSTMSWNIEMLKDEKMGGLNNDQKSMVSEIENANKKMIELVESLLNVSRIDLGTFYIDPHPVNLQEFSHNLIGELSVKSFEKNIKVIETYGQDLHDVDADKNLLHIILENLLTNAIKYSDNDVNIEFSIDLTNEYNSEKEFVIKVKNFGLGIPESEKDKIFTKLFRASNVTEKISDGTGLGLYVVKSILDSSGGRIWFDSVENESTTFYVSIPEEGMKKKEGTKGLS